MGWLSGPAETKQVGASAFLSQIFGGGAAGEALYPEPSFTTFADQAFGRNELVYACIMEKATSLPEAPLRVYGGDGLGEPRDNHPLRVLMANPNAALTEFELMELTVIHLDLAGNAVWEIVLDRAGRPAELWPLMPDRVRIYPRRNGQHEYGYQLGDGNIVPLGTNVIHFKMPNPVDPYLGQAPLRPALRAVALDNEATDFVKALLQNRAVPGTIIETEQAIDEATADRLEARWFQKFGGARRGGPAFLQKGMKPHALGLNLKDLEFPDLRTISESRICMDLGVPPILVGAKVGLDRSTFANYHEARSSFWEETLMPLQQRMQQSIVKKLMPYFAGPRPRRTVVKFDNSDVRALRESEGKRWELATQALRAGGITVNQFARQVGLPTDPDGDVYLRPAGVIPTDAGGRPMVEFEPVEPTVDDQIDGEDGAEQTSKMLVKATRPDHAVKITDRQREKFAADIAAFAETQRAAVLADLQGSKSTILAVKAWDVERWDEELSDVLLPHMRQSARSAARGVDKDADVTEMDAYLSAAAGGVAAGWNTATRDEVAKAAKVTDWEDAVGHAFDLAAGVRATTLAGSLATEMAGFGAVDTAKRVGFGHKTWNVNSGNARSAHAALDGETVPIGETFSNGANWPGDASLPDDERAGCQCSVTFEEGS